jgi:uncharacterized protein YecE (DUF72 family)
MEPLPVAAPAEKVRIGTCAWSFEDWRGVFFPEHLAASHRLEFYARYFGCVEVDSTFYGALSARTAQHWEEVTPKDFVFTVKMPRQITHDHKLREVEALLDRFLAGLEPLQHKLGCVLVQLPPYFVLKHDERPLREFLHRLLRFPRIRFAVEFRHPSWHLPRITHLLEQHGVCWVWSDASSLEQSEEGAFEFLPKTPDFLYLRLLGDVGTKYAGDGSRRFRYRGLLWPREHALESWALRIGAKMGESKTTFVLANNHFEGFAPQTCARMAALFGQHVALPGPDQLTGRAVTGARQMELL